MGALATPLMIASTVLGARGAMQQGDAAKQQAYSQAAQLDAAAGQDRASAQRSAAEQRRQARLAQSALMARAGGAASDAGVVSLDAGIAGEGEYRALTALFQGEEEARGKEFAAANARATGDAAKRAARTKAFSSILAGGSTLFDKYGGGGPGIAPADEFVIRNGYPQ